VVGNDGVLGLCDGEDEELILSEVDMDNIHLI
jgi:hypothetical protein